MRYAVLTFEALARRDKVMEVLGKAPQSLLVELSRHPDTKNLLQDSRFRSMMLRKANGP
jgi:hypothetical protein